MRYLFIVLLFISFSSKAQLKSFKLTPKGDTLNRVDMKGLKQGPWIIHVDELRGERGYEEEGVFVDDKREGIWKRFSLEEDLIGLENYRFGMKDGKCQYFTNAGEPLREESWRAIDPKNPYDTVDVKDVDDPSKVIKKVIVKVEPISYKNGTWTYYNTLNGTIEKTEQWVMNKPKVNDVIASEDELAPIDVTGDVKTTTKADEKKLPKPQAILEYEKKNSGKKKVKVRDGRTGG